MLSVGEVDVASSSVPSRGHSYDPLPSPLVFLSSPRSRAAEAPQTVDSDSDEPMPTPKRRRVVVHSPSILSLLPHPAACPPSASSSSSSFSPVAPLTWSSLPVVLLSLSLSHLDLRSLLRASTTCHSLHRALSSPDSWQHLSVLIADNASPFRICDFTFPSVPSTIRPVHHPPPPDLFPPHPHGRWVLDACLGCLLPLRHLLIDSDNDSFLTSLDFLAALSSLRTLTLHITLDRWRRLHPLLKGLTLPSLSDMSVLLDVRFKDLNSIEAELFQLPAHLPLHLHLHLRAFKGGWEDGWVDGVRRWKSIEGLDVSMKHWVSLSEDHLRLLLQGDPSLGSSAPPWFQQLTQLSLRGQDHLFLGVWQELPQWCPTVEALDLTNCTGLDETSLHCLHSFPRLHTLSLTLHEAIGDAALSGFLSGLTGLRRLTLSAKSQVRRQASYQRTVLLPLPAPGLIHLAVQPSVRLRVEAEQEGMETLQSFDWEGGGGPYNGVLAWVLRRERLREVRAELEWEERDEESKESKERWEEMGEALRAVVGGAGRGRQLQLVRTNAKEHRMRQWRRIAPHICFAPTGGGEEGEGQMRMAPMRRPPTATPVGSHH